MDLFYLSRFAATWGALHGRCRHCRLHTAQRASQADPCTRQKVQLVRNGDVVSSVRRVFVGVEGL